MSRTSFDIDAVVAGRSRLTGEQAMELYRHSSLRDLGQWAWAMASRLHPEDYRTYVIDRNINYTNVCTARCTFCAFRRDHGDADSYALDTEQISAKIRELLAINGTQVLMQGGMNDRLPIEYYEDLLRSIRSRFPSIHIHAFSPPEFVEFERFFNLDAREILQRFRAAGLDTIPGGGGEIFSPRVRRRIGIGKCDGDDWLRIMRIAHELGMHTSATMLIGHIEFVRERIEHMAAIRAMQDYALALGDQSHADSRVSSPGCYTSFILWPFQRENTPLGRAREWDPDKHGPFDESANEDVLRGRVVRMAGAHEYLRMLAIARLYLDNVPNIQSSWVTMGPKIGQLALMFGANDMGSVMMEENVVSAAGTTWSLNEREICRLIRDAGWTPAQRDQYYSVVRRHDGPDSPDKFPPPEPVGRRVRRIDDRTIGAAPGLDDGADRSLAVQLPILGDDVSSTS